MENIYVYWHNSGMELDAMGVVKDKKRFKKKLSRVVVDNAALFKLALMNRECKGVSLVGSNTNLIRFIVRDQTKAWRTNLNWYGECEYPEDEQIYLRNKMLEDALRDSENPGTMILIAPKGPCGPLRSDYLDIIKLLDEKGWGTEVLSWGTYTRKSLREWGGNNTLFISLDDFYDSLVYIKPAILDITKRPRRLEKKGE